MEKYSTTDTLPTQVSLLDRLKNLDDSRSWEEFFHRYKERVVSIARTRGLNAAEAEDVAQEVFKRVARTICTYQPMARPGSFRSWLFKLTRWRAADQLRERGRLGFAYGLNGNESAAADGALEGVAAPVSPEDSFEAESRQHVIEILLKRLEGSVAPKHLQAFQMLVLDEAPAAKVANVYGISIAAVYVIRHRVTSKLRAEMSRLQLPLG